MPIVNNVVLYTEKFMKTVVLKLSVFTTEKMRWGLKETCGCDEDVYYLDSGDGFRGVCIRSNSSNVYIKYVQFGGKSIIPP